jgi:FkbM family methyltransferase
VVPTRADALLEAVNRCLADLTHHFSAGDDEHVFSLAGRPEVRFPQSAGGRVHGGSASWVAKKHADGAVHEPGLLAALLALAEFEEHPRTVLDVGALYGYVSLVAASVFPEADVHAFEANPRSYVAMESNLAANRPGLGDRVRGHYCALSDESRSDVRVRVHRMRIEADAPGEPGKGESEHEIDVWTLDDLCEREAIAPGLVKIDVEGYQAKIVPGMRRILAEHRPVVLLEFDTPGSANDFGVPNREVVRPLMDDGYRLLWGRHRSATAGFEELAWSDLTDRHEVNSLGILVP